MTMERMLPSASLLIRCARVDNPVFPLELFGVRSFAVATLATTLFIVVFYALLLANVLFLTSVWGWSVLQAGVALTPGPLTAAESCASAESVAALTAAPDAALDAAAVAAAAGDAAAEVAVVAVVAPVAEELDPHAVVTSRTAAVQAASIELVFFISGSFSRR